MEDTYFKYKKMIYRMSNTILLFMIVCWGLGHYLGVGQFNTMQAMTVLGVLVLLGLIWIGGARTKGICFLTIGVCCVMLFVICGGEKVVEFLRTYMNWLGQRQDWNIEWEEKYRLLQMVWITLGCYLLQVIVEKIPVLQKVIAIGLSITMMYAMIVGIKASQVAVAAVVGYVTLAYVEYTQKQWKKEKTQDSQIFVVWTLPFYICFVVILLVTPVSEEPYDWKFAKQIYSHMKESFTVWYEDITRNAQEDFGMATSGFSEDGRLLSGLIPDNRELMTIQGNRGLVTNIYLIGKVYDTFLGQEWIQTAETTQEERFLDAMETLYTVSRLEQDVPENYLENTKLSIRYEHFNTGYVFAPVKTWQVTGIEYMTKGADMVLPKQVGYATEYEMMYYQMNVDHPAFYALMEQNTEPDEELWDLLVRKHTEKNNYCYQLEDLQQYREMIEQIYAQEIEISQEAEAYLKKVTEASETPLQRLRAIERELSSYTYTLQPGRLPEEIASEEQFLDYFLLESKKGYCSYFATAFVLLARAEGFPARYVEGFCVPKNAEKQMTVYSNMAHAWPEVYIDGIGWIPFEPTPGYEEIRYTPWKHVTKQEAQSGAEKEYYEDEDWFEFSEEESTILIESEQKNETGVIFPIIITAVAAVIIGSILIVIMERIYRKERQKHLPIEEQFLVVLKNIFWILEKLGLVREQTQTLQEFHEKQIIPFLEQEETDVMVLQTIRCYESYLYGQKEIAEEMLQQAENERQVLLGILKEKKRWLYYVANLVV